MRGAREWMPRRYENSVAGSREASNKADGPLPTKSMAVIGIEPMTLGL